MGMAMRVEAEVVPVSSWYVVRTATRREDTALEGLQAAGLTVWLPMEVRWGHRFRAPMREPMRRPLFPGYLFVLCPASDLAAVWEVDGVHAVVSIETADGPRPMAVPVDVMLALQSEEREGLFDYTRTVRPVYRPKKGEKVRVMAGTYMNFLAKVLATPRGQRAHLMIEGPFGRGKVVDIRHLRPV